MGSKTDHEQLASEKESAKENGEEDANEFGDLKKKKKKKTIPLDLVRNARVHPG